MGYKIFYNLSPEYLQDHFKQYLPTTTIGLRNYSGRDNKMFNVTVSEMRQNTIFFPHQNKLEFPAVYITRANFNIHFQDTTQDRIVQRGF